MQATMQVQVVTRYGPPEVLEAMIRPRPFPKPGEVLVRVAAAGINPADARFRAGQFRFIIRFTLPFVPGSDVAGVVETLGEGATRFAPGDRVFAMLPVQTAGGYAEFVAVPEHLLAPVPAGVTLLEAAAVPLAGLTALQALRDKAAVQPGQRVLVYGASGGVGSFSVQLARALGAHVTGVSSGRNLELLRELGAHEVLDYTQPGVFSNSSHFDVVFDAVNHFSFARARPLLGAGGVFVTVNPLVGSITPDWMSALWGGRRVRSIFVEPSSADLRILADLMASNKLRSVLDQRFDLSSAAQAHRAIEGNRTRGKLVLSINPTLDNTALEEQVRSATLAPQPNLLKGYL